MNGRRGYPSVTLPGLKAGASRLRCLWKGSLLRATCRVSTGTTAVPQAGRWVGPKPARLPIRDDGGQQGAGDPPMHSLRPDIRRANDVPGNPVAAANAALQSSRRLPVAMICSGVLRFPAIAIPSVVASASHSRWTTFRGADHHRLDAASPASNQNARLRATSKCSRNCKLLLLNREAVPFRPQHQEPYRLSTRKFIHLAPG
jgi:hypothetical protein